MDTTSVRVFPLPSLKPLTLGHVRFLLLHHRDYPLHDVPAPDLLQPRLVRPQLRIDRKPRRSCLRSQQVAVTTGSAVSAPASAIPARSPVRAQAPASPGPPSLLPLPVPPARPPAGLRLDVANSL